MPEYTHPDQLKYPVPGDRYDAPGYTGNDWVRDLAVTTQAALNGKVSSDDPSAAWYRGDAPDGTDWNTMWGTANAGAWSVRSAGSAGSMANLPPGVTLGGQMQVISTSGGSSTQLYTPYGADAEVYFRASSQTGPGSASSQWNPWKPLGHRALPVPDGTDWWTFKTMGVYRVQSPTSAATMTGLPDGFDAGIITATSTTASQTATVRTAQSIDSRFWIQGHPGLTYSPWTEVTGQGGGGGSSSDLGSHSARVQALIRGRGGRVGTGGKGVVALRFDHNMTKFQSVVLPELVSRSLPGSQCHFVDEMNPQPGYTGDDSTGSSWAQVQDNAIRYGIEVWSHGWSHTDAPDTAAMHHEFVESRDHLEAEMPEVQVVGLMRPGVTGSGFGGWYDNGSDPASWTDYEAGRIVAATYASCDGSGALLSPLGVQLGWQSYAVDTDSTSAGAISVIDDAAATRTGAVIMLHPSMIDRAGGITLDTYREILDHIVTLRDAGEIEVLTVGGMVLADPASSSRHDLEPRLSKWVLGAGWARTSGQLSGTGPTGTAYRNVSMARQDWARGHAREAHATVEGTGTATLRVLDTGGSAWLDQSATITGPGTLRLPVTIPHSLSSVRLELTVTSGTATITAAGLRSL